MSRRDDPVKGKDPGPPHADNTLEKWAQIIMRCGAQESPHTPRWTLEQIAKGMNEAFKLFQDDDQFGGSGRDEDLLNLFINTTLAVLAKPDVTLDEVMDGFYPHVGKTGVRSWWNRWS